MNQLMQVGSFISGFVSGVAANMLYDHWIGKRHKASLDKMPKKERRIPLNPLALGLTFFGVSMGLLQLEQVPRTEIFGWIAFGFSSILLIAVIISALKVFLERHAHIWMPTAFILYMTGLMLNLLGSITIQTGIPVYAIIFIGLFWMLIVLWNLVIMIIDSHLHRVYLMILWIIAILPFWIYGIYQLCSANCEPGILSIAFGLLLSLGMIKAIRQKDQPAYPLF